MVKVCNAFDAVRMDIQKITSNFFFAFCIVKLIVTTKFEIVF